MLEGCMGIIREDQALNRTGRISPLTAGAPFGFRKRVKDAER